MIREIGGALLVLLGVVVLGNLWFHLVEGLLDRLRRRWGRPKEPPAWHPLPPDWQAQAGEQEREDGDAPPPPGAPR